MKILFNTVLILLLVITGRVYSQQTIGSTVKEICKGTTLVLKGPTSPRTKWFKDGLLYATTKDITVKDAGDYVVVAVSESGCESDASAPVHLIVWDVPSSPIITGITKGCLTTHVILTAQAVVSDGQDIKYEWFVKGSEMPFTTGNVIDYEISKNEILSVKATGSKGFCTSSLTDVSIESLTPFGDFVADKNLIDFGKSVQFNSNVTNAVKFEWNFGDGFTSTTENPIHFYNKSGMMNITLKAYSPEGCLLEIAKPSYITVNAEQGKDIKPPAETPIIIDPNPFVFKVYPNPVVDHMNIDIYSKVAQKATIEYYAMDGRILNRYEESLVPGNNTLKAKSLYLFSPNSNYLVRITLNNQVEVFQIFKATN
jgi:hypothetical protein